MKKMIATLLTLVAAGLAVWSLYLLVSAPDDAAALNHAYRVSAYAVTWAIQLGYLAWMAVRWQKQSREDGE